MTDLRNNQRDQDSDWREHITITIDDIEFDTADADQEAASLVRLAGRDPEEFDLFVVDEQGVETHVNDAQIVNLYDGGRFRTRQKVRFTIDRERHTSWDDDQTVAALLRLIGVDPTKYDLTRVNAAGNPETFSGDQVVTIHDGDEFVTDEREKIKVVTIIVNTRPQSWHEREITFEQLVELAFPGQPYDPTGTTVEHSRGHGKDKPLRPGESVRVKEGMVFDVESANRS